MLTPFVPHSAPLAVMLTRHPPQSSITQHAANAAARTLDMCSCQHLQPARVLHALPCRCPGRQCSRPGGLMPQHVWHQWHHKPNTMIYDASASSSTRPHSALTIVCRSIAASSQCHNPPAPSAPAAGTPAANVLHQHAVHTAMEPRTTKSCTAFTDEPRQACTNQPSNQASQQPLDSLAAVLY
jgi:hypothetical protein